MSVLVLRCLLNDWVFLKIAEGRRVVRTRIRSRVARIRVERTRERARGSRNHQPRGHEDL